MTVDYEHGWDSEVWTEMEEQSTILGLDYDSTEFLFFLPPDQAAQSICAVKVELETV